MLEIIILSITQGITEFLPISSSAHLILISNYLDFSGENLTIDVSLHIGSLIAVIFFFLKEILNFLKNKPLLIKIIIGSLPTLVFGFLLVKSNLIDHLRNIYTISLSTLVFGILLFFADKSQLKKKNIINNFSYKDAIYVGLLQTLSLIPGVSRSGITITGARFLKFNRVESAKISFLLSIPTLLATSSYNITKIIELKNLHFSVQNFWAILFSFIFSLITLRFFIKFLKKFSLIFFVFYRVILGMLLLLYAYFY